MTDPDIVEKELNELATELGREWAVKTVSINGLLYLRHSSGYSEVSRTSRGEYMAKVGGFYAYHKDAGKALLLAKQLVIKDIARKAGALKTAFPQDAVATSVLNIVNYT